MLGPEAIQTPPLLLTLDSKTYALIRCIASLSMLSQMGSTGGGQFGQNGQKLHGYYKISIFGSKQWGDMGGTSQFFRWGDTPIPQPPVYMFLLYKYFYLYYLYNIFMFSKKVLKLISRTTLDQEIMIKLTTPPPTKKKQKIKKIT